MKKFFWKDKSGRGFTNTLTSDDILKMQNEQDWNDEYLHDFAVNAEPGDEWENEVSFFICIE